MTIPHSKESEEATLGAVMINPNCLYDLMKFLRAEHFYIDRHKWIWDSFLRLDERRIPIDIRTIEDELERMGKLAEIGGPAYLTGIINLVPSSLNAVAYGKIVLDKAIRRKVMEHAQHALRTAQNDEITAEECVQDVVNSADSLGGTIANTDFVSFGKLLSNTYDDIAIRHKDPKEVWGLATGFPTYDKMTGGHHSGELVYLAGPPGVGKSFIAASWGYSFGQQAPGIIISLEMGKSAIGRRLLSGITGVSSRRMKSGMVTSEDWQLLTKAITTNEKLPIFIDDSSYDTHKLRAALETMKREQGIKWFILDYALLLTDSGKDETEQTKLISANMQRIVHDLKLSGTVLHSVVKIGMDNDEPRMADQRGSGQAIHDADVQLFLTKLYDKDDRVAKFTPEEKARMATLWCSKGRDLEQSKFRIHLTRKGTSPFWCELDLAQREEFGWEKRKDTE